MFVSAISVAAAMLLLVAGVAKVRTPGPAAGLFPRAGRSVALRLVRGAGAVEAGIALAAIVIGGRLGFSVLALAYLVLVVLSVRLASAGQPRPCGCFGAADGDAGWPHVVVNVACLIAVGVAASSSARPASSFWDLGALAGTVVAAQSVLLAALAYLSISALPALTAARRSVQEVR